MQFQRAEDSVISVLITLVNGPARSNPKSSLRVVVTGYPPLKGIEHFSA